MGRLINEIRQTVQISSGKLCVTIFQTKYGTLLIVYTIIPYYKNSEKKMTLCFISQVLSNKANRQPSMTENVNTRVHTGCVYGQGP